MSLSVVGVWQVGVWAQTVWADGVWREGDAPDETPAEVTGGGNWSAFFHYEQERERRRFRRIYDEEREEAVKDLPPVDREIAGFLQKQEREDERRADLERLRKLAIEFRPSKELPPRVNAAIQRAQERQTFSALMKLDKELRRMLEEEELAVLLMLAED